MERFLEKSGNAAIIAVYAPFYYYMSYCTIMPEK